MCGITIIWRKRIPRKVTSLKSDPLPYHAPRRKAKILDNNDAVVDKMTT
jgi:hypothetical protein